MSNYEFKVTGDKALFNKLARVATEAQVKEIVKRNTSGMQREAMEKAPVDTGNLKRNIDIEIADGGGTGKILSKADYSGYPEFGTRFMAAQPFMGPAFRKYRNSFVNDLKNLTK
ncbi:HK97-gp10 family putative phage morphogenesis protein [Pediococcus pentosaceus]|uniref:HK97-gp10 family putative phage morphogenesis protein n=1 Tax=Pediococcus pentosaceus TaxID=1255 RepID=UPI00085290F8|nr:HK97-gp10 family putative phage morphogenesis protein [Pediococcus pentosaceus]